MERAGNSGHHFKKHRFTEGAPRENLHPLVARWGTATETRQPTEKDPTPRNQDAWFALPEKGAFGIFDGVGISDAAQDTSDFIQEAIAQLPPDNELSENDLITQLKTILQNAHQRLLGRPDAATKDGTTATIVKLWQTPEGKKKAIFLQVGDSRGYIKRAGQDIEQVTVDDDILPLGLVDKTEAPEIRNKMKNVEKLSELSEDATFEWTWGIPFLKEDAAGNPFRTVGNSISEQDIFYNRNRLVYSLGGVMKEPTVTSVDVETGDLLLLTSDGVTDNSTEIQLNNQMKPRRHPRDKVKDIVSNAKRKSMESWTIKNIRPKNDDITAEIIEVR